ncbi:MAG: pantoate--beta-alanine ligase [Planctomycetes bacterium]|nr:pantoate--beta-alanine ligase [Planctomycetota bacterium]
MISPARVVLGIGSNLGDRIALLAAARRRLEETGSFLIMRASSIVESEPIGPPQPRYLNQVLIGETRLPPEELVAAAKRIETELGRRAALPWGPREIDIDVLAYGALQVRSQSITLPHPEIAGREFVLAPWAEIDADAHVPGLDRTVAALLADLRRDAGRAGRILATVADEGRREMKIVRTLAAVREWRDAVPAAERVGFVPTMGALHEGHRALVARARDECAHAAVSVFVNPFQFGAGEDFASYPRDEAGDAEAARAAGADLLWFAGAGDLYPTTPVVRIDFPDLAARLCGRSRPGHFAGVALIVAKLFHIFRPTRAYFGEKDFQQLQIVRRLARDLDFDVEIVACPTVREGSGLALSSRNRRLSAAGRNAATALYRGLNEARRAFARGERSVQALRATAERCFRAEADVEIEYLELVAPDTLAEAAAATAESVLLVAARIEGVRLIDNVVLGRAEEPPL